MQETSAKNITEFSYRKDGSSKAKILLGLELQDSKKARYFLKALKNKKYSFTDLSNDEISKKHLKFMHGGEDPTRK